MKVYLSGGMKSHWQEKVKTAAPKHRYIDPSQHGMNGPSEYTIWDFTAVVYCDVVFAYMENDNPSGIGLSAECAYAKALGKTVILVDEKNDKYMAIVRSMVSICYPVFEDGIRMLVSLQKLDGD